MFELRRIPNEPTFTTGQVMQIMAAKFLLGLMAGFALGAFVYCG